MNIQHNGAKLELYTGSNLYKGRQKYNIEANCLLKNKMDTDFCIISSENIPVLFIECYSQELLLENKQENRELKKLINKINKIPSVPGFFLISQLLFFEENNYSPISVEIFAKQKFNKNDDGKEFYITSENLNLKIVSYIHPKKQVL